MLVNLDWDKLGTLAERVGVPGAVLLIVAIGIAVRGPALWAAFNGSLKVIMDYRLKRRELDAKIKRQVSQLQNSVEKRLNPPPGKKGPNGK